VQMQLDHVIVINSVIIKLLEALSESDTPENARMASKDREIALRTTRRINIVIIKMECLKKRLNTFK